MFQSLTGFRIIDMPLSLATECKKTIGNHEAKISQCKRDIEKRENDHLDDVDIKTLKNDHETEVQNMKRRHQSALDALTNEKDHKLLAYTTPLQAELETCKTKIGHLRQALPFLEAAEPISGEQSNESPVRNLVGPSSQASGCRSLPLKMS
jgi:predicted  nucleic acid-binding Zn-ribbon protein